MPVLKPFVINQTDIQFILDQLNFIPLFDAPGNAIIQWDGTGAVYDQHHTLLWDTTGGPYTYHGTTLTNSNYLDVLGTSYQTVTDLAGLRDVTGLNNNLTLVNAEWGAVDQIFTRSAFADYAHYSTLVQSVANTVYAAAKLYYGTYSSDGSATDGTPTGYLNAALNANYAVTLDTTAGAQPGDHVATDGTAINIQNVVDYTPRMISLATTTAGVTYDVWKLHQFLGPKPDLPLFDSNGVAIKNWNGSGSVFDYTGVELWNPAWADGSHSYNGTPLTAANYLVVLGTSYTNANTPDPAFAAHAATPNEIYYGADGKSVATVLDWGQLETVANGGQGQIDTQARLAASAGQNDHFIGALNPGVSPSNGFFALFGQFFDHGLDFIDKSSGAKIKITLATDDPLYGMKGPDGQPVHEITMNRATVDKMTTTVDANGVSHTDPQYVNHTSPYIDQSQTYGSHEQLTSLLREWVPDTTTAVAGDFHAGMKLFDGHTLETAWAKPDGTPTTATLPTLDELRAHVEATGRTALTWEDVSNLRNRDASGHVIADGQPGSGTSGSALLLDMNPRFDLAHLRGFYDKNGDQTQGPGEASYANTAQVQAIFGDPLDTINKPGAIAILNADVKATYGNGVDLHINASGVLELTGLQGPGSTLTGASALYPWVNFENFGIMQTHANMVSASISPAAHAAVGEILMASVGDHYIAGDGRVNENFGLTSIHHIFHEEHNYQVQNLIDAIHREAIVSGDLSKVHEFQIDTGHGTNAAGDYLGVDGVSIAWDQDKLFNGAKLVVEMEYQHAAVDQYARNVTPNIQEFVGYSADKNAAVSLEYAQAAFRFGHSTLRETIDTIDPEHGLTGKIMGYALKEAFLNPDKYAAIGPSSILLGMSHQQMNEVDEFVTPALNQGLLDQPLDLAAINIARGRDLGIPTLNDFREAIGLTRYTSWTDFGQNMQHQTSLVNFIAAYSFDGNMEMAKAIIGLVEGTVAVGSPEAQGFTIEQAYAFLDGGDTGFEHIDTWLGGLAEIHQPGGLLGETFDKVFVNQIESLMDGDRFYYLFRLAGQQFAEEVGNGQLKDIVERNTGLTHLNGNIFGYADQYIDLGAKKEVVGAEALTTGDEHKWGDLAAVDAGTIGIYSNGGRGNLNDGKDVVIGGTHYIQDTRLANTDPNSAYGQNGFTNLDGTPNSGAESNEVIVGSKGNDLIYAQGGDDTVYGEGGNDKIYGGYGIDRLYGGDGADKMYGGDNPDLIDGGAGDDFLYGESSGSDINGADQVIGGSGNDLISGGIGIDKLSGGTGDDKIYGDQDTDPFTHGSDGNDYVDGGSGGDILYGDNGDDIVVGGADQDQLFGGNGDDILRPGDATGALTIGTDEVLGGDGVTDEGNKPGTLGFDIIDFSDNAVRPGGVKFDLGNQLNPGTTVNGTPTQIATFQIEGLIGSAGNDTLIGSSAGDAGNTIRPELDVGENWIVGGSGNDNLTGGGGNDLIVGGSVRLDKLIGKYNSGYTHNNNNTGATQADQLEDALYQGASHRVAWDETIDNTGLIDAANALGGTQFDKHFTELLRTEMFKDTVLGDGGTQSGTDTVVYTGNRRDYTIQALKQDGTVVADPVLTPNLVYAIKITDHGGLNDDGTVRAPSDGTDLVIDVDNFTFHDGTKALADMFSHKPAGTVGFTAEDTAPDVFGTPAQDANAVRLTPVSALTDVDNVTIANPTGAVTNVTYAWTDAANAPITTTGSATAPYIEAPGKLVLHTTVPSGVVVNEIASYTDLLGTPEQVTKTWNIIVGTQAGNAALNGADKSDGNGGLITDVIFGLDGNDNLSGGAGSDMLFGGAGVDNLDGGAGADQMSGGGGNDHYYVNDAGDTISETATGGFDVVHTTINYTLADNVEQLMLTGAATTGTGNSGDNVLHGLGSGLALTLDGGAGNDQLYGSNVGANTLIGGTGSDTLIAAGINNTLTGGDGNDQYYSVSATDTITETNANQATGGYDTLHANYTVAALAANVEQLILDGTANINGTGNALDNTLIGNSGKNILNGGAGRDTMIGGDANDTYYVDNVNDVVMETNATEATGGFDVVHATVNYTLTANVEQLMLEGAATIGTGNSGNNVLHGLGSSLALTLNGGDGNDTLYGSTIGGNTLNGGAGDDTIIAAGGGNTLTGGAGNDIYYSASSTDTINEVSGGGASDSLYASYDVVSLAANVENLSISGAALIGTGNSLGNTLSASAVITHGVTLDGAGGGDSIFGTAFDDTLIGGTGNDRVFGGGGDDSIIFNAGTDGRDFVDGGANTAGIGDRFTVNGDASNEVFRIYSNMDDWNNDASDGIQSSAAHAGLTGLSATTEIVITRNTNGAGGAVTNATIIAELDNIEEITINAQAITTGGGNTSGQPSGDSVVIVGNFNPTSLNFNTITVNGSAGADTVDITGLTSDHRVVLTTNGGSDTIIGDQRAQDLIDSVSNAAAGSVTSVSQVRTPDFGVDPGAGSGAGSVVAVSPVRHADVPSMVDAASDSFVFATGVHDAAHASSFQPGDAIDLKPVFATLQLGGENASGITALFTAAGNLKVDDHSNDQTAAPVDHTNDNDQMGIHVHKTAIGSDFA
jgi:Ca2+-binding RTX toxin-like protein